MYEAVVGDDLADLTIFWFSRGSLRDFSSGWTFTAKVFNRSATQFTKSSGFTGAAGNWTGVEDTSTPNLTIQWATTGELNSLAAGTWDLHVHALRSSDSRRVTLRTKILVHAAAPS